MLWYGRLEANVESRLNERQSGFRKDRGVRDVWWMLEGMLRSRRRETYVGFVDFKKAFDRVWREGLWYKMDAKGVKGKMLRMIKRWYEGSEVKAEWMGAETGWMDVDIGVRQGCVLSGLLFAVYVDDLLDMLELMEGVRLGEGEEWQMDVEALMYADDLTVMAEDAAGLEWMLEELSGWCKKWRMDISVGVKGKSEVVVFG